MKTKKEVQFGFKVEEDLAQAILRKCSRLRVSKSALIRQVLMQEFASELDIAENAGA